MIKITHTLDRAVRDLQDRSKTTIPRAKQRRLERAQGIETQPIRPAIIYRLHNHLHFKPRWGLGLIVKRVFQRKYQKVFQEKMRS